MKASSLKYLFILCFAFCTLQLTAQVERTKMIGAYVYNLSRYTKWPNEAKLDSFRIVLISRNSELVNEFKVFSKELKIKDKPISLEIRNAGSANFQRSVNLVFLDQERSALLPDVIKMIEGLPILLVSENYDDKYRVMINLYDTDKNELLFEVNKANILNHNLKIDPEILLLGGTEIDIAGLYRSSQKEMEQLEYKMSRLGDSLAQLNQELSQIQIQIIEKQKNIENQQRLLYQQNLEVEKGKGDIAKHRNEILEQKIVMQKQNELLANQSASLREQLSELGDQQSYISKQQFEIQKGKVFLDSLTREIKNKNIVLDQKTSTIEKQKQTLIWAIIAGILAFLVLMSMVSGYRSKVQKNRQLTKQRDEIETINKKLEATNRSLYSTISQLNETQSQLVASEKMASLGVLTSGIAHEINNPVNFIYTGINSLRKDYEELISYVEKIDNLIREENSLLEQAEQIKKDADYDEIKEIIPQTIDDIKIGAERAAEIIRGLRNFSRIDRDAMQVFNIHEGIDSALLLLRNKFKNHIKIEKNYGELPMIECYPGKLNQVFLNIIGNSIDAIEKEGVIAIETKLVGDHVVISINDTGKGIAPEIIDKIFDPFFTTKSVGKGVGLGLSISFGIIKEHNGKIDVKSETNKGTIFTISLPCEMKTDNTGNYEK